MNNKHLQLSPNSLNLYYECPLCFWLEKKQGIKAIGQYSVMKNKRLRYRLDFAIFCQKGKLNIECDDLKWHFQPKQRAKDKKRDRWLKKQGWTVFRFSGEEIKNNTATCVKILEQAIQNLGGLFS